MRPILWFSLSSAVLLTLSGCVSNGGYPSGSSPSGTGPFDSQGNYHEEWANDPSKWRKPGSHSQPSAPSDEVPVISKNEQPPLNASPFAAPDSRASSASRKTSHQSEASKTTASKRKSSADKSTVRKTSTRSNNDAPKAKSKSKSTAKTKTRPSRYVVKKGDQLWSIAERYNLSIPELRKANNLSSNRVKPGKSLVIPKN